MDRRRFLSQMSWTGAAFLWSRSARAERVPDVISPQVFSPVKVKGRVMLDGRGIAGVGVSDGRVVVPTGKDGRFSLVTDRGRSSVFVSLPKNAAIPVDDLGCAACYRVIDPNGGDVQRFRFDLTAATEEQVDHAFFALADPQTQNPLDMARFVDEAIPDLKKSIESLSDVASFAAACGDIMYDNLDLIPDYQHAVSQAGIPFVNVAGNHDVDISVRTDAGSLATFERHFGPADYSFNRGEVHYIVLDDVFWFGEYFGYVTRRQLAWLAADLALVEPGSTVVIFVHIPPYTEIHKRRGSRRPEPGVVVMNREILYRVLENHRVTFVCGHTHESEYLRDGAVQIDIGGAACGAWWTGPICSDGTPNGYSVYRVRGSELRRSYKATGFADTYQMRIYPPGTHQEMKQAVMANVWAADDTWTIRWYEDGHCRGSMLRHTAKDPRAIDLFEGRDKPESRTWVEPQPTRHMYFAQPRPGAREIVVEAETPWGRKFSDRLRLTG